MAPRNSRGVGLAEAFAEKVEWSKLHQAEALHIGQQVLRNKQSARAISAVKGSAVETQGQVAAADEMTPTGIPCPVSRRIGRADACSD